MRLEIGVSVQYRVEVELKYEVDHAPTLNLRIEARNVKVKALKVKLVEPIPVQVR